MNQRSKKKSQANSSRTNGAETRNLKKQTNTIECGRGQKVIAKDDTDGLYYSGIVEHKINNEKRLVVFDNGREQTTNSDFIIPIGGAISRPVIRTGDYVLVEVQNQYSGRVCFIPGIVEMMPRRIEDQMRFYSVLLFNSQMATTLRCHLTKITKKRFEILCKFLLDKDMMKKRLNHNQRLSRRSKSMNASSRNSAKSRSRSCSSSSSSPSVSRSQSNLSPQNKSPLKSASRSKSRSQSVSPRSSVYSSRSNSPLECRSPSASEASSSKIVGVIQVTDKSTNTVAAMGTTETRTNGEGETIDADRKHLQELEVKLAKQQSKYERSKKKLRNSMKKLKSENKELMESQNGRIPIPKIAMNDVEISTSDLDTVVDCDQAQTPAHIISLRQSLPVLSRGTPVVARWSTEGWYYRGVIQACHFDASYHVRDSVGNIERIYREDIIDPATGGATKKIEIGDSVIVPHPKYAYSYTPAKVIKTRSTDHTFRVESYDGQEITVKHHELFPLSHKKYDYDVDYIRKCEDKLIGEVVVARNDDTGAFQIGQVRQKLGRDARYVVKFAEGHTVLQYAPYIYSALNRRYDLAPGDRILALARLDTCTYLPGRITGRSDANLAVTFCDRTSRKDVQSSQSFWLSAEYYNDLVDFYNKARDKEKDRRPKSKGSNSELRSP